MESCKHLYGFYEGYGDGDDPDYERPTLIDVKNRFVDIKFIFCPLCGEKLQ